MFFLVSRNKPKQTRNRSCFGLFRFEPKTFFFHFEDTLGGGLMICIVMGWPYRLPLRILPFKELLSCELLTVPAAAATGILLNVHKTPSLNRWFHFFNGAEDYNYFTKADGSYFLIQRMIPISSMELRYPLCTKTKVLSNVHAHKKLRMSKC